MRVGMHLETLAFFNSIFDAADIGILIEEWGEDFEIILVRNGNMVQPENLKLG
jgi:hypothetical protein